MKLLRYTIFFLFLLFPFISLCQNAEECNTAGLEKYKSGDYKGAIKDFNKAIFKNYRIPEYYFNRAQALLKNNQPIAALENYNKAIKEDSGISYYYSARGYCKYLADQGKSNYERYLEDYNIAISLDSTVASDYYFRGFCKFGLKNYRSAIEDYTKSIELDSLNPRAYIYRGLSRIKLGDHTGCDDFHKAVVLGDTLANESLEKYCFNNNLRKIEGKYDFFDSSFYTNPKLMYNRLDSIEELNVFHARNKLHVGEIGKSIFKLPINECLTKEIKTKISISKDGDILKVKVLNGATNVFLDSLLEYTIQNFEGKWTPLYQKGVPISYNGVFVFGIRNIHIYTVEGPILEKTYEKNLYTQVTYSYQSVIRKVNYNYQEDCENNEYYYRKGNEEFSKKKYKLAKYNFIRSLESNSNDLASRYNLGMSYLRLGKNEKACQHFKICAERGDIAAQEQFKKLCQD